VSEPRWDRLGELYRDGVDEPLQPERALRQRERLAREHALQEQQERQQAPVRWWRWGIGVALAAAAAVALVLWVVPRDETGIECYTADGRRMVEGQRVAAPEGGDALRFADGTRVDLIPGSVLRAERLANRKVELVLERGRLEARVRAAAKRTWLYRAGPYRVRVVGTAFSVDWKARTRRLAVAVARGVVRVSGGAIPAGGRRIAAGQRIEADPREARVLEAPRKPRRAPPQVPSLDSGPAASSPEDAATGTPKARPRAVSRRWQRLMLKGKHEAAWREAKRVGLSRLEARASASDLLLLADLARLRGRPGRARRILLTVRRRFARRAQAALAAFELGRLAAARGDHAAAARLFGVYLEEQPRGGRAADALGRRMVSLRKLGRLDEARRLARAYLAAYPGGTYAGVARGITGNPK
jgi:hypothetical protein